MGAIRIGAVIAQKYQLEAPLARGGMGSVWAARHVSLGRRLAIKFISPEVAGRDDVRTRFDREARAAASLQSPHVVQIHDYGIDDDVPYLVMELLDGEDLGERLSTRGRLQAGDTLNLVRQVARALRRLGEAGIVHRDLKPSNLFIVRGDDDDGEIVKLLDFGIAKVPRLAPGDFTRSGVMIGSPRYMSPEQARGSPLVDHRSDLWSLSVIAYRAMTGRMPFHGADVAALVVNVCNETPPPPSRIDAALGPEIDAFFAKALARAPDDRFQTARELVVALEDAMGEPPVSGRVSTLAPPPVPVWGGPRPALRPGDSARPPARASAPTSVLTPSPAPAVREMREIAPTRPSVSLVPAPVRPVTMGDPPKPPALAPPEGPARGELLTLPEPSSREPSPRDGSHFSERSPIGIEDTPETILPGSVDVPGRDGRRAAWRPLPALLVALAAIGGAGLLWALAPPRASWVTAPPPSAAAVVAPSPRTAPEPLRIALDPLPAAPSAPPLPASSGAPGGTPRKHPSTRPNPILGF